MQQPIDMGFTHFDRSSLNETIMDTQKMEDFEQFLQNLLSMQHPACILHCPQMRSFIKIDHLQNKYPLLKIRNDSLFQANIQTQITNNKDTILKNTMDNFQIEEDVTSFHFKRSEDEEEQPRNSFMKQKAKKNDQEVKRESGVNGFSLFNSIQ